MKILIAYGTTEGQTRKIADHMATAARNAGHAVDVHKCTDGENKEDVNSFDAIVVAASVHQARYQPAIYRFVEENLNTLRATPSAFVSVSLSRTFTEGMELAEQYYKDFANETGWQADLVHHAEGAIRYTEYDFFKIQTIEHVVFKGAKKMPPKVGNPEFTDWSALDAFISEFIAHAMDENRASTTS